MAIRKQAREGQGAREYITAGDGGGGYHSLLADILERWVQDARGHITDCPCEHNVQQRALEAMGTTEYEDLAVVKVIAQELEIKPEAIIEALKQKVVAA